jgi:hypothetical protein
MVNERLCELYRPGGAPRHEGARERPPRATKIKQNLSGQYTASFFFDHPIIEQKQKHPRHYF